MDGNLAVAINALGCVRNGIRCHHQPQSKYESQIAGSFHLGQSAGIGGKGSVYLQVRHQSLVYVFQMVTAITIKNSI